MKVQQAIETRKTPRGKLVVVKGLQHIECPQCGEQYSGRNVTEMKDHIIVHSSCSDNYRMALRAEADRKYHATQEAERVARETERKALKAERGDDLSAWLELMFQNEGYFSNEERALAVRMERQSRIMRTYPEKRMEFIEKLNANPGNTLSWSLSFFTLTAEWEVARHIVRMWLNGCPYAEIKDHCQKEALREMRSPSRSTSPSGNLMDQCLGSAWASFISEF